MNIQNLKPRDPDWGQKKKPRNLSLTDPAFDGLRQIAEDLDCKSISDLLERIGRKALSREELKKLQ